MKRFIVTHTEENLWSVSHNERVLSVYRTEAEALAHTFRLASNGRQSGGETAVVITRARRESQQHLPKNNVIVCCTPSGDHADTRRFESDSSRSGAIIVSMKNARSHFERSRTKVPIQVPSKPGY